VQGYYDRVEVYFHSRFEDFVLALLMKFSYLPDSEHFVPIVLAHSIVTEDLIKFDLDFPSRRTNSLVVIQYDYCVLLDTKWAEKDLVKVMIQTQEVELFVVCLMNLTRC
jgi:hypothetical protein